MSSYWGTFLQNITTMYTFLLQIGHYGIFACIVGFARWVYWDKSLNSRVGCVLSHDSDQRDGLTIVYSTVYSGADHRKHQSSASLAFVREIHRWPVNSPHKGPVTWKMSPFDDVTMESWLRDCTVFVVDFRTILNTSVFFFQILYGLCLVKLLSRLQIIR